MSPLLLAAFTAALALVGAPRLASAAWVLRAPRLAVITWITASAAVLVAGLLTGLTLLLYWDRTHDLVKGAWHVCLDALLGRHDRPAQVAAVAGLAGLGVLGWRLLASGYRTVCGMRFRRAQLRLMIRIAGVPSSVPGATVVRHHEPAAYLMPGPSLPGRHADIIITSAAVARLREPELSAVLAHERAHHTGHHYELTHWMRILAQAFPALRCFQLGRRQVDRLVELCADDAAARTSDRIDLARALVSLAQPPTTPGRGDEVLAVHGGDGIERLNRLLSPPPPLSGRARGLIALSLIGLLLTPIGIAVFDRYTTWVPSIFSL
ncbi:M56 family metallopeptidase [Dactylosporangium sucinum]|uniref:Peptidase M48 domain-containing protein n=1 Tax=Dactylosporangium sucinum TaxID=1424081 RepID=A0A917U920_9ACTN|nr:M56 family metallopeptidase [Dactylosporangium sucinum]GGM67114.1 hypothetical protein GCM10007977_081000 [Dactylosporangium sucinum]